MPHKAKVTRYGNITVERVSHNGHLILSTVRDGHLHRETYVDFTVKEALKLFRNTIKQTP